MQSKEKDNLIFVRLFTGDLHQDLEEVCRKHGIETAVILCGMGQLKNFRLGYFSKHEGDYTRHEFAKPYGLISLTGHISNQEGKYDLHMHAALGGEDKSVIGGHLIKAEVEMLIEVVLLKTDIRIRRRFDKTIGAVAMSLE